MRLADLVTITRLAKGAEPPLNRRTLYKRLRRLHGHHGGDWLVRMGRTILINPTALRAAHPGVFDPPDLVAAVEDLKERTTALERDIETVAKQVGGVSRRLRVVEARS